MDKSKTDSKSLNKLRRKTIKKILPKVITLFDEIYEVKKKGGNPPISIKRQIVKLCLERYCLCGHMEECESCSSNSLFNQLRRLVLKLPNIKKEAKLFENEKIPL